MLKEDEDMAIIEEYEMSLSSCKQKIEWLEEVNKGLLEACKRALPWVGKLIADEIHLKCAMPKDAENTLEKLQQAISKAEGREE